MLLVPVPRPTLEKLHLSACPSPTSQAPDSGCFSSEWTLNYYPCVSLFTSHLYPHPPLWFLSTQWPSSAQALCLVPSTWDWGRRKLEQL